MAYEELQRMVEEYAAAGGYGVCAVDGCRIDRLGADAVDDRDSAGEPCAVRGVQSSADLEAVGVAVHQRLDADAGAHVDAERLPRSAHRAEAHAVLHHRRMQPRVRQRHRLYARRNRL